MDVNVKLLQVFDTLEKRIQAVQEEVTHTATLLPEKGERGLDGKDGAAGPKGKDGRDGKDGKAGKDGRDGVNGEDGVSVVDADVDFDNKLRLTLSDGTIIDAGDINVEKSGQIYVGGGGSSGGAGVKYTAVSSASYTIQENNLIQGHNIYGVDSGANSVVYLPVISDPTKLVVVSNEMTNFTVTTQPI